jgi:hypothetical protein
MRSVKLTVLIEDSSDLDMEVRVVAPEHEAEATAGATPPVVLLKPRPVPATRCSLDDEYTLGGYAGI